jgi:hypothetical protein
LIGGLTATSSKYKIKVRAFNAAGYTDSKPIVVVLAAVPDTPLTAPSRIASSTDATRITVAYGPLLESQNGGSDVLSYELQVDNGIGGAFSSLIGNDSSGPSLATSHTISQGIEEGVIYRFRYRARNVNGWSGFSPIAHVRAANAPARPDAPILDLVDETQIQLTVIQSIDDGGGAILRYELWRNQGTGTADFVKVADFAGTTFSHTLAAASGGLTAGQIYQIRSRAENQFGFSEFSEELHVGLASYPAAPASLTKVAAESGPTFITLEWAQSADTELPVLGYLLSFRDNQDGAGAYRIAFNGTNYPNVRKFTVAAGMEGGMSYSFKVQALNFNGAGPASSPADFLICIAPSTLDPPAMTEVTKTTMTLRWTPPSSDGGCQIKSYSLYMDDGAEGAFAELDAASINNKPTLRTYQVTSFAAGSTSKSFRFKLRATNEIGSVDSREVTHVLAAVPDAPAAGPTLNPTGTTQTAIRADYAALTPAENGGAPILSYELQVYNYTLSAWTSLAGQPGA